MKKNDENLTFKYAAPVSDNFVTSIIFFRI